MPGGNCTSRSPGCIPPAQSPGAQDPVPAARCRVSGTAPWAAGREGQELGACPDASGFLGGTVARTVPAGSLLDKRARTLRDAPAWVPACPADVVLRGPGTTQMASRFPGWHCRPPSPGLLRTLDCLQGICCSGQDSAGNSQTPNARKREPGEARH